MIAAQLLETPMQPAALYYKHGMCMPSVIQGMCTPSVIAINLAARLALCGKLALCDITLWLVASSTAYVCML
jgi:hypothetical protein